MPNFTQQDVKTLLSAALECSFYIAPEVPGLTQRELFEVGERLGMQSGEMSDALLGVTDIFFGQSPHERLLPKQDAQLVHWQYFLFKKNPTSGIFKRLILCIQSGVPARESMARRKCV